MNTNPQSLTIMLRVNGMQFFVDPEIFKQALPEQIAASMKHIINQFGSSLHPDFAVLLDVWGVHLVEIVGTADYQINLDDGNWPWDEIGCIHCPLLCDHGAIMRYLLSQKQHRS